MEDCVSIPVFHNLSTDNHSTTGGANAHFSGANFLAEYHLKLYSSQDGNDEWTIDSSTSTDTVIYATSPEGVGKGHAIHYEINGGDKSSTGIFFSYAAPVIYNITA